MDWTAEQWAAMIVAVIGAVSAAVVSIIRAWRGEKQHQALMAMLAPTMTPLAPGAVPTATIGSILRILDYAVLFTAHLGLIRDLPPGGTTELPKIRTLIDGRDLTFGETPVKRNR